MNDWKNTTSQKNWHVLATEKILLSQTFLTWKNPPDNLCGILQAIHSLDLIAVTDWFYHKKMTCSSSCCLFSSSSFLFSSSLALRKRCIRSWWINKKPRQYMCVNYCHFALYFEWKVFTFSTWCWPKSEVNRKHSQYVLIFMTFTLMKSMIKHVTIDFIVNNVHPKTMHTLILMSCCFTESFIICWFWRQHLQGNQCIICRPWVHPEQIQSLKYITGTCI